ncbi:MAG: HEAT repeat domain-containing protein [Acidobacteria bacterium]|nr:HEAT repeat domain-containing protein [Acidobacteriota bacterium]
MKNTIRASAFCIALLTCLSAFLWHTSAAKEDPIEKLLMLPAPPRPNPLVKPYRSRDKDFYNPNKPPRDDAPADELIDYWIQQASLAGSLRYTPEPSAKTLARLKKEIEDDPSKLANLVKLFGSEKDGYEFVKSVYDNQGENGSIGEDDRSRIREWLTNNSPYYSDELRSAAEQVSDVNEYVSNQEELLALTRYDFNKARPIIDRLMSGGGTSTRALALWALYRHALDTDSLGDIERYRDELKAMVENKDLPDGMRDLAMDALVHEKDFPGRDDWYYGLMSDETLVKMQRFTGLTTLIRISPDEKYADKMIDLLKSSDRNVRGAAVRNLTEKLDSNNPDILRALLPWLEDKNWAVDNGNVRRTIVQKLSEIEMPEAVPSLIALLDERSPDVPKRPGMNTAANSVVPAAKLPANMAANAVSAANAAVANALAAVNAAVADFAASDEPYPLRNSALDALIKQKDPRAAGPLRRLLGQTEEPYAQRKLVQALFASGGFTTLEQMDAIEAAVTAELAGSNVMALSYTSGYSDNTNTATARIPKGEFIRANLFVALTGEDRVTDELASALVSRIANLDKRDPARAQIYRRMILRWQNAPIDSLLLLDIRTGRADAAGILRSLARAKALRETHGPEIAALSEGVPSAQGLAACFVNEPYGYAAAVENTEPRAREALYACARLIRAELPIAKAAIDLNSPDKRLSIAAERYLISEDSPEAQRLVRAKHPNEAFITGSWNWFFVDGYVGADNELLANLFFDGINEGSVYLESPEPDTYIRTREKQLREEVLKTPDLNGVYWFDDAYIRLYKDRVVFSWDEDESRYRERVLERHEFDEFAAFLADNDVDSMPPYIDCDGPYCLKAELLMLGKNGGRRIWGGGYMNSQFFKGLIERIKRMKAAPADVKYALAREVPGLEVISASDQFYVDTVWKSDSGIIASAIDRSVRTRVADEIRKQVTGSGEDRPADDADVRLAKRDKLKSERRYEGRSWKTVTDKGLGADVAQPAGFDQMPVSGGFSVAGGESSWKARIGGVEYRGSNDGIVKWSNGRSSKLTGGSYTNLVLSGNGRWLLAGRLEDSYISSISRIDTATGKVYPVAMDITYGYLQPDAYIPSLGKILVSTRVGSYEWEIGEPDEDDAAFGREEFDPDAMRLVDPATGAVFPAKGEFRPLAQQTFRPLQAAGRPNEFWAAITDPESGATDVGIYETKFFTFRSVKRLPKIVFSSMAMYVDEPANKIYFAYRGHLLAVPLK